MGHEIVENLDNVGLRGEQAWHGLGVVVDDNLSAVEAGDRFNLFWPVAGFPLFYKSTTGEFKPVDSHVANVRTKDAVGQPIEHLLGVVGADYQVCQNRELADFTDALAQTGKVVIETCGSIRGGKRVWFLARGESFDVGGTDKVHPYVLVSNAHDGTQAIRITPTSVRVVCSNTLHLVIPDSEDFRNRPETAAITIRHSGKIADKLDQARRSIEYYGESLKRNRELFEALQAKKFSQDQAMQLFAGVYAVNWKVATGDELKSTDESIKRLANNRFERMQKASEAFLARYRTEVEAVGNADSAWAYFNALSGYIQHDKSTRGKDDAERVGNRIDSNLFGLNADRTHQALAETLSLC